MKAKITNVSDPLMWYYGKVGKVIDIIKEDKKYYWVREDAGLLNIIHKHDAKVL